MMEYCLEHMGIAKRGSPKNSRILPKNLENMNSYLKIAKMWKLVKMAESMRNFIKRS